MRTVYRTIGDDGTRGKLCIRVDNCPATNDNFVQMEVAISLHVEAANKRCVNRTTVAYCEQVKLTQARLLVDPHIAPYASSKHVVVKDLERGMYREDTSPSRSESLVNYPPLQMVRGPPMGEFLSRTTNESKARTYMRYCPAL
jgi:hypothetical protein